MAEELTQSLGKQKPLSLRALSKHLSPDISGDVLLCSMPSNTSQRDAGADTQYSNEQKDCERQDGSSAKTTISGETAQTRLVGSRSRSGSNAQQQTVNHSAQDLRPAASRIGSLSQSQDEVQKPGNRPPGQPAGPPCRDQDGSFQTTPGTSSTFYFEPQGELLHNSHYRRPSQSEFNIPHAIGGAQGRSPDSELASDADNGVACRQRSPKLSRPSPGTKRKSVPDCENTATQGHPKRVANEMPEVWENAALQEERPATSAIHLQGETMSHDQSATDIGTMPHGDVQRPGPNPSVGIRRSLTESKAPTVLPARKVFPIQIGDRLFRLSGASISSDAPSYFSQFFEEQLRQNQGADNIRTLYIDRDPATFEDISLHLQGYHVEPRDGPHYVKLFADAQFFSLPRLTAQLFSSSIYIRIGETEFQISRDLFNNPGDSPNYLSLGFSSFFTTPTDIFPGLAQRTLLRPPSILPPSIPNRSARTFADLLHILKGYPLKIRNEEHRQELLRDARYFHLKGLEQRLIPHQISHNLARKVTEIVVRLEDIRSPGISFLPDSALRSASTAPRANDGAFDVSLNPGWICYQRPYVDTEASHLIVEIGGEENMFLSIAPASPSAPARFAKVTFHKQALSRINSLFSAIAAKTNMLVTQPSGSMEMEHGGDEALLPSSSSNNGLGVEQVKARLGTDADITVDGEKWVVGAEDEDDNRDEELSIGGDGRMRNDRKRGESHHKLEGEDWIVQKAQWRLRVQPTTGGTQSDRRAVEVILGAVKIVAISDERSRNASKGFLS